MNLIWFLAKKNRPGLRRDEVNKRALIFQIQNTSEKDLSLSAVARFGEIFTLRRAPDDEEEVQANVLAVAAQAAEMIAQAIGKYC